MNARFQLFATWENQPLQPCDSKFFIWKIDWKQNSPASSRYLALWAPLFIILQSQILPKISHFFSKSWNLIDVIRNFSLDCYHLVSIPSAYSRMNLNFSVHRFCDDCNYNTFSFVSTVGTERRSQVMKLHSGCTDTCLYWSSCDTSRNSGLQFIIWIKVKFCENWIERSKQKSSRILNTWLESTGIRVPKLSPWDILWSGPRVQDQGRIRHSGPKSSSRTESFVYP